MPRKVIMPAHLEAFLVELESQNPRETDRLAALDAAEKVAGMQISLKDAQKRYPDFKRRYSRWEERLHLAMQDAQIGRVIAGKASATPLIAALAMDKSSESPSGPSAGGNGRSDGRLGRHQAGRKADFNRW